MNSGAEHTLAPAKATLPSNTSPHSKIGEASESSICCHGLPTVVSPSQKLTVSLRGLVGDRDTQSWRE